MMSSRNDPINPFLKWVGGKRWLAAKYSFLFPSAFKAYREPFLGGGAVLFYLRPKTAIVSDVNPRLIATYKNVKDHWKQIVVQLQRHQVVHSDEHYYKMRELEFADPVREAARFLYLNRACFNGIYRENLQGKFNVPKGTKTRILLKDDDFEAVARVLAGCTIRSEDFEKAIDRARSDDFIFIDPPYTVKHNNNGFIKYNHQLFCWDDQIRLRDAIVRAHGRGAKILVTNANHASIRTLYRSLGEMHELSRPSILSASSDFRGASTELAITINYSVSNATNASRVSPLRLSERS